MRILEEKGVNSTDGALDGKVYRKLAGNSGEVDALNTSDLAGGSKLELTDTGEKKIFDEDSGAWNAVASGGGGTTVVANPTLAGTEDDLTGLQVGSTKYKVPSGGGGGSVLVAHAQVEESVIESLDENPVAITLDKTLAELAAAEQVYFNIDLADDGEPIGSSYVLPAVMVNQGSGMYVCSAMLDVTSMDMGGTLAVMAQGALDGSLTQTFIMLIPASSGGGAAPFVLHGTITSQSPMAGTVTESAEDLAAAVAAGKRVVFAVEMGDAPVHIDMTTQQLAVAGVADAFVSGFFYTSGGGTSTLLGRGYVTTPSLGSSTLTFKADFYTLTPVS